MIGRKQKRTRVEGGTARDVNITITLVKITTHEQFDEELDKQVAVVRREVHKSLALPLNPPQELDNHVV